MSEQKTITINGTVYDARTGLPVQSQAVASPQTHSAPKPASHKTALRPESRAVHQVTQKSQTLNRRTVRKSASQVAASQKSAPAVQKSPAITKFAPHPAGAKTPRKVMTDIGPVSHPLVEKANAHMTATHHAAHPAAAPKPSSVIKEEAIAEAMEKAPSHKENSQKATKLSKRHPRFLSIASASIALLLLGGYFTYLNMPSLSVRVAAAQAGINASYPEYRPDGYGLRGPVAYNQNEVMMKFAANAGPQNFTITQAKSSWDSSAVLDNYVKQKAGDNYITYNERGLTIYTFDGNAAWVNGGILYTIDGDAPLSTDQIRRIATSM